MNNETQSNEVLIEKDGQTWRWGDSSYFKRWSGFKQTVNTTTIKALTLPAAILFGVMTFFFSDKKEFSGLQNQALDPPMITHELPMVETKILDSMPNTIRSQKVQNGVVGQIKVFSLRNLIEIPVGSEAKAKLDSGASNGIVKGHLVTALIVDGEPILPEGSSVFGYGKSTEDRLYVEFTKVVLPSGEVFTIRAQALDAGDKILGLKGTLVSRKVKKMTIGIGLGLLGGFADGLQISQPSLWGGPQKKSVRDAALAGTSQAALDQSKAYLDDLQNAPNVIEVKKGTEFYLIIDEPKKREDLHE